jgi:hypothetical protein
MDFSGNRNRSMKFLSSFRVTMRHATPTITQSTRKVLLQHIIIGGRGGGVPKKKFSTEAYNTTDSVRSL